MAGAAQRDRDLVSAARRGDVRAFTQLVEEHQDAVYRLCARHSTEGAAEDLAQETFLRAFAHRESIDPSQSVRTWLLSIAHRLCIDRFRTRRDFAAVDVDTHAAPAEDIDARIDARSALSKVQAGLATLPAGQREAIALYHLEGLEYAEVARTLGVPIGTVMSWLHRGRERLRRMLAEVAT